MIRVFYDPNRAHPHQDFEADLVFYASDGDGDLYVHLYTEHWARTGGGKIAAGQWEQVEEVKPAEERLAPRWVKGQNGLADDPDKIPARV